MTDDLVKRLREVGNKNGLMYADYDTTIEAADRIEALEAALRNCCDKWENGNGICEWLEAVDEARAALGEKKDG